MWGGRMTIFVAAQTKKKKKRLLKSNNMKNDYTRCFDLSKFFNERLGAILIQSVTMKNGLQ